MSHQIFNIDSVSKTTVTASKVHQIRNSEQHNRIDKCTGDPCVKE